MPKVWISDEKNYTAFITCTSLLSNINPFMFHRFELWVKVSACTLYLCSFSERRVIWGLVHLEPGESPCPHISMTPLQCGLLLSSASNSRWNFFHPHCICKVLFQCVPHLTFVTCLCIMNSLMMWMETCYWRPGHTLHLYGFLHKSYLMVT